MGAPVPALDPETVRPRLAPSGAQLTAGLTHQEFRRVESKFGFRFGADHRELLSVALPTGPGWPDWRHGPDEQLRSMLAWPDEGILERDVLVDTRFTLPPTAAPGASA